MQQKIKLAGIVLAATLLTGCAQILGDLLFPNQCIVCRVYDYSGTIWSSEECGGGQNALETECKAKAYDEKKYNPNAECECNYKSMK